MNEWMAVSAFPSRICELSSRLSVVIYCAIRCVWMCECECVYLCVCVCRNDCVGLNVCLQCLASSLSSGHLFNIFTDLFFLPFSFAQLIFFPRQSDAFHRFRSFILSPASICHRHTQNDESNINTLASAEQIQFIRCCMNCRQIPCGSRNTAIHLISSRE